MHSLSGKWGRRVLHHTCFSVDLEPFFLSRWHTGSVLEFAKIEPNQIKNTAPKILARRFGWVKTYACVPPSEKRGGRRHSSVSRNLGLSVLPVAMNSTQGALDFWRWVRYTYCGLLISALSHCIVWCGMWVVSLFHGTRSYCRPTGVDVFV